MEKKKIIQNGIVWTLCVVFVILVICVYMIPTECAMCKRYILPSFEYSMTDGIKTISLKRVYNPCKSCNYTFPLDTFKVGSFIHYETIVDSLYQEDYDYYQKGLINGKPQDIQR